MNVFFDLIEATGINMIEAIVKRYVAITRGGASAKRIKIAAKETESTPTNRIIYGFTPITVLS
jgi:hypothetical protein